MKIKYLDNDYDVELAQYANNNLAVVLRCGIDYVKFTVNLCKLSSGSLAYVNCNMHDFKAVYDQLKPYMEDQRQDFDSGFVTYSLFDFTKLIEKISEER
jgi:hypothetical protein